MCIDLPTSVAMGSSPIPPVSGWQNCDLDSAVKLQAQACVFDSKIFQISGQRIGSISFIHTWKISLVFIHTYIYVRYDVCSESFSQGVYIFEDTFEHWQNSSASSNKMLSAR